MCRPKAKVRTKGESTYLHRYVLLPLDAPRNFSDTYFIHMLFPLIFGLEPSYIYHSIQHIFFSMVVALSREVKNCAYTYFYLWRAEKYTLQFFIIFFFFWFYFFLNFLLLFYLFV